MSQNKQCSVCRKNIIVSEVRCKDRPVLKEITCSLCGSYILAPSNYLNDGKGHDSRHLLSGYIREHNLYHTGYPLTINDALILSVMDELRQLGVTRKAEKLLLALAKRSSFPSDVLQITPDAEYPLAYATNAHEFTYYMKHLIEEEFLSVKISGTIAPVTVTPKGWQKVYELESKGADSKECFVAMSFDKKYDEFYKAIIDGVKAANRGFIAKKLNDPQDPDLIDNSLIARMRASRFMIADLSMNNHGVYYESGYMRALGRHVIFTCKKRNGDETLMDKPTEKLHFDVNHMPILFWEEDNLSVFADSLKDWILAWGI